MKTALRLLLPLLFVPALAACGNKGPLVMPPPPPPVETPAPLDEDGNGDDDSGAARGA